MNESCHLCDDEPDTIHVSHQSCHACQRARHESCLARVMSLMWRWARHESCLALVMSRISHVTHVKESYLSHQPCLKCQRRHQSVTHANESCGPCHSRHGQIVMAQMWKGHGTHVKESWHTCEGVISTHVKKSWYLSQGVMSQMHKVALRHAYIR